MAKKAVTGEEYKILKQKSTPKRIAKIFIFFWVLLIMAPVLYVSVTQANRIKEYAVVKGVYEANKVMMDQYASLSENLINQIDISKYTAQIEIPQIKLDNVSDVTTKVTAASNALAKLGVKNADKVEASSQALQQKVNQVNQQIQSSTQKIKQTLQSDIQAALKKEVAQFGKTQVQKQLNLSNAVYAQFSQEKFGLISKESFQITTSIYQELTQGKTGIIKEITDFIDCYFKWISLGVSLLLFVILLIPVLLVWWIARKLSANFTECPYCGKVFLSKKAKFNLLKLFS